MYKKILTIQDLSCFGQCSLTVALPIISACGIECAVLPSAVLSTHTYNFKGYTFHDLTDDIPDIAKHWNKEGIAFDAVYTGYIGSIKQIEYIKNIFKSPCAVDALKIVDPAMGDYGILYPGFDKEYAKAMMDLAKYAHILIPNITEACYMLGDEYEYKESYDENYVEKLVTALYKKTGAKVVLTGVSYKPETTGVVILDSGNITYYEHEKCERSSHGTGDIYSAAFTGAYMRGFELEEAARIAANYTLSCIKNTQDKPEHWYGACFESQLPKLIKSLE